MPHAVHADVPLVKELYWPVAHAVHAWDWDAATWSEYAPAAQMVHPGAPVVRLLYAPAGQPVHPEEPVVRLLYVPAAHAVHTEAPVVAVYVPARHPVHADAAVWPE